MRARIQILATIERFNQIPFDEEGLAALSRLPFSTAIGAISWLLNKKYIYRHKGKIFITVPGHDFLAASGFYSEKRGSFQKWKEEALTGMIQTKSKTSKNVISDRSTMDKAVLSTCESLDGRKRPDEILSKIEDIISLKKSLSQKFSLSPDKVDEYFRDGRFRICNEGEPHIGIFHRRGRNGWQHLCIDCRKRKRSHGREKQRLERNCQNPR